MSDADVRIPLGPPTPVKEGSGIERRRSVVRVAAELGCLLCGRDQGILEADTWPPTGSVRFHPALGHAPPRFKSGRFHCGGCGGSVIATEVTSQRVWSDVPVDWTAERSRRGRPPKWLVAQRAAAPAA